MTVAAHKPNPIMTAWRKLPIYARVVALLIVSFLFAQFGFALFNIQNSFAVVGGVACLLTSMLVSFRTLQSIFKEMQ